VRVDGKVQCWGEGSDGQLGNGDTGHHTYPVEATGLSGAVEVAAGGYHTCAIAGSDREVWCWGLGSAGQLGNADTASSDSPVRVSDGSPHPLEGAVQLAAGLYHTCAVLGDGTAAEVYCWGANQYGQLGDGAVAINRDTAAPVRGLTDAVQVVAGDTHTCALTGDGAVWCWGSGNFGQLGSGNKDPYLSPVQVLQRIDMPGGAPLVLPLEDAVQITAGSYHTCALVGEAAAFEVLCWGWNGHGQLGTGTDDDESTAAVQVADTLTGAILVEAGDTHTCALTNGHGVSCWGGGTSGQLGNGLAADIAWPVPVSWEDGSIHPQLSYAVRLAAGSAHTCALLSYGYPWCWGDNSSGQIGSAPSHGKVAYYAGPAIQ
jgi:alpha-tubulin suppressor-like RCC1 family protein